MAVSIDSRGIMTLLSAWDDLTGPKPRELKVETARIDYLTRTPKVEKLSLQPISYWGHSVTAPCPTLTKQQGSLLLAFSGGLGESVTGTAWV